MAQVNCRNDYRRPSSTHGNGIVLLVLTGSVRESDQESAERAGVDYVFHKPLEVDQLRRGLPCAAA